MTTDDAVQSETRRYVSGSFANIGPNTYLSVIPDAPPYLNVFNNAGSVFAFVVKMAGGSPSGASDPTVTVQPKAWYSLPTHGVSSVGNTNVLATGAQVFWWYSDFMVNGVGINQTHVGYSGGTAVGYSGIWRFAVQATGVGPITISNGTYTQGLMLEGATAPSGVVVSGIIYLCSYPVTTGNVYTLAGGTVLEGWLEQ